MWHFRRAELSERLLKNFIEGHLQLICGSGVYVGEIKDIEMIKGESLIKGGRFLATTVKDLFSRIKFNWVAKKQNGEWVPARPIEFNLHLSIWKVMKQGRKKLSLSNIRHPDESCIFLQPGDFNLIRV